MAQISISPHVWSCNKLDLALNFQNIGHQAMRAKVHAICLWSQRSVTPIFGHSVTRAFKRYRTKSKQVNGTSVLMPPPNNARVIVRIRIRTTLKHNISCPQVDKGTKRICFWKFGDI